MILGVVLNNQSFKYVFFIKKCLKKILKFKKIKKCMIIKYY